MIFCKDCKYFRFGWYESAPNEWCDRGKYHPPKCIHKECFEIRREFKYIDTPIYRKKEKKKYEIIKRDFKSVNLKNNCKYYQRKWWKFWIRNDK